MKKNLIATVAVFAIAGSAFGVSYTTDGNGLAIADDAYDGSLGSMTALTIDVADSFSIADLNVTVDIAHTWTGDLVWKLESPGGSVVDLLSRAGFDELADDGEGCCGSASDLVFGNTYTIDDDATDSSELLGFDGFPEVPSGSFYSSGFGNDHGLSTLNGENSAGTWTLYIGDSAGADLGTFDGFTLDFTAVPAPGAFALLGLAGFCSRRRRA